MLRAKVYPPIDYLISFLQTRGFLIVEDKEQILHYTGTNEKELFELIKEDKPDLLILHRIFPQQILTAPIFWVWHPVKNEKELYSTKKLITNSYRMSQTYYQRLGIQAEIQIIPKKEVKKHEYKFVPKISNLKKIFQRINKFMIWE